MIVRLLPGVGMVCCWWLNLLGWGTVVRDSRVGQPVTVVLLVWVVCGGLFVICIVVASIFVLYCFLCFV